jgi:hypothetical protein
MQATRKGARKAVKARTQSCDRVRGGIRLGHTRFWLGKLLIDVFIDAVTAGSRMWPAGVRECERKTDC